MAVLAFTRSQMPYFNHNSARISLSRAALCLHLQGAHNSGVTPSAAPPATLNTLNQQCHRWWSETILAPLDLPAHGLACGLTLLANMSNVVMQTSSRARRSSDLHHVLLGGLIWVSTLMHIASNICWSQPLPRQCCKVVALLVPHVSNQSSNQRAASTPHLRSPMPVTHDKMISSRSRQADASERDVDWTQTAHVRPNVSQSTRKAASASCLLRRLGERSTQPGKGCVHRASC